MSLINVDPLDENLVGQVITGKHLLLYIKFKKASVSQWES